MPHVGFDLRQRDPPGTPGLHKNRYQKGGPGSPNNRYVPPLYLSYLVFNLDFTTPSSISARSFIVLVSLNTL